MLMLLLTLVVVVGAFILMWGLQIALFFRNLIRAARGRNARG